MEYGFGYVIMRSLYTPYSIYLRGLSGFSSERYLWGLYRNIVWAKQDVCRELRIQVIMILGSWDRKSLTILAPDWDTAES